jgi:hypothetical protein
MAAAADGAEPSVEHRGPSLPAHLERVVLKLSNARAMGRLGDEADALLDRLANELDVARGQAGGLRGEPRAALLMRLRAMDGELMASARAALPEAERQAIDVEADQELAGFRDRMTPDAYLRIRETAIDRLVRDRIGLPVILFT